MRFARAVLVTAVVAAVLPGCSPPYVSLDANPSMLCGAGTSTLTWNSDRVTNVKLSFVSGPAQPSGSQSVSVASTTTYEITGESSVGPRQDFAKVSVATANASMTVQLLYKNCVSDRAVYETTVTQDFLPTEEIKSVRNLQSFAILLSKNASFPIGGGQTISGLVGTPAGSWQATTKLPAGETCPPPGATMSQPPPGMPATLGVLVTYGCQ